MIFLLAASLSQLLSCRVDRLAAFQAVDWKPPDHP